jgi:hypothetical protein
MTITDTEKLISTLTQQDIRALRHADSIVFRQYNGQGTMEAIKDGSHTPDGFEQKHYVYVECGIADYGNDGSLTEDGYVRLTPETATCFHMENTPQYDQAVTTILRRLGTGDTLRLVWTRDNNSEIIRNAGLHVDSVKLEVSKKGDPKRRETYLVDVAVTYDNSARMIRQGR